VTAAGDDSRLGQRLVAAHQYRFSHGGFPQPALAYRQISMAVSGQMIAQNVQAVQRSGLAQTA
jgi:hypothetical protein